jgi:hypothetical protein
LPISRIASVTTSNVRLGEGRQVVVGEQDALAAEAVVEQQVGAQLGFRNLRLEMLACGSLDEPHQRRVLEADDHPPNEVDAGAFEPLQERDCRSSLRVRPEVSWSWRGMIHGGVRWKTVMCPTAGWIAGTNCTADAPVPITATRFPVRSKVC